MDIVLPFIVGIYIIFALISFVFLVFSETVEFKISTWEGVFNSTFAHEVSVYRFIKDFLNKKGIAIIMTLWTAICLPINIVLFAFILLAEIIRGIVIVFLKFFGKR